MFGESAVALKLGCWDGIPTLWDKGCGSNVALSKHSFSAAFPYSRIQSCRMLARRGCPTAERDVSNPDKNRTIVLPSDLH